jgi:hypothetical protein
MDLPIVVIGGLSLYDALQKFEKMYLCTMIDVRIFSIPAKASSALLNDYYHQSIVFISLTNSGGVIKMSGFSIPYSSRPFYYIVYHHRFILTDLPVLLPFKTYRKDIHATNCREQTNKQNEQLWKYLNKTNNWRS